MGKIDTYRSERQLEGREEMSASWRGGCFIQKSHGLLERERERRVAIAELAW